MVWLLKATLGCTGTHPGVDSGTGATPTLAPSQGMHRLNSAEYNATVEDTLGSKLQPAGDAWGGQELAGFDNIASQLGVDKTQYDRFFKAAQALASDVTATPELMGRFVDCDLVEAQCVDASIKAAGLRLFRRPLEAAEVTTYRGVYASALGLGDDESAAFGLTLQALLASAEFVYRFELDPQPASPEAHPLGAYELASRLSYLLWSSAPDDALLESAKTGSLLQADTLSETVDRLLQDPKAQRFSANFAGQWLGARQAATHPSPAWGAREAGDAAREMLFYFGEFLNKKDPEWSWFEFPTADFNYVLGDLPHVYYDMRLPAGLSDLADSERRVSDTSDQRAGFFGLAGFLALTSMDRRTSPSKRGKWIAGNLLCAEPPPPNVVPELKTDDQDPGTGLLGLDVRQRLEEHRKNPACASCHALFDPYGLALEAFDPIGRYRETYDDGSPIDVSVTLPASESHPEGVTVTGLAELSQQVAQDPRFGSCVVQKLLTYALGTPVGDGDEPLLQPIRDAWLAPGETPSLRRLVHALVSSDAFRYRRGGP